MPVTWNGLAPVPATIIAFNSSNDSSRLRPGEDLTHNWSSLIGIVTAIVGNVLIALALNVQRYAHIKLHKQRVEVRHRATLAIKKASSNGHSGGYGTVVTDGEDDHSEARADQETPGEASETDPLAQSFQSGDSRWSDYSGDEKVASTYLKSPYWWLGQVLITVGEMGNFLAYGFAPASIVSPLGVVALISNCIIAPALFKESFRRRDFCGVVIAIAGAVTVVLSANQEETKLEPHDVWDAITTLAFEIYVGVTCFLILLLVWASPRYGHRTILIDLGLVGLFGGYTVLATKGVSSMLSSALFRAFTTPVTYVLVLILLGTAILQVRYVNKALQRFDSTQVIPIQFVMFTLSVIIGSAVLYRDFENTTAEQAGKFVGGCLLTFFGVFLITSGRAGDDDEDEEALSEAEGVEETIGLSEQASGTPQAGAHPGRRESTRSRRSSRVNFMGTVNKPLTVLADSSRIPAASTSRVSILPENGETPSHGRSWRDVPSPSHPGAGRHTKSSDSVATFSSSAAADPDATTPLSTHSTSNTHLLSVPGAPSPSRPSTSSRTPSQYFQKSLNYSPSPFSSTVKGLVADTLLKRIDSPTTRRLSARRSRPSLRSSLYVPSDELDEEQGLLGPPLRQVRSQSRRGSAQPSEDEADSSIRGARPGEHKGTRGRARSLSHTLGDLFGGRRSARSDYDGAEESGPEDEPRRQAGGGSTQTF